MSAISQDRRTTWMVFSVALHVAVIGALFLIMAPPRQGPGERQQPSVSERRLQEVHQQLHRVTLQQMQRKLETLEEIEKALEKTEEERREEYASATEHLRVNALVTARKDMETALEQQAAAADELEQVSAAAPRLAREFDRMIEQVPRPRMP